MPDEPLARDPRVALAEERTLLAWVRTGVALMGFGFVVARFGVFLREVAAGRDLPAPPTTSLSVWIGATLVVLGVGVTLAAAAQHRRRMHALAQGRLFPASPTFGLVLSALLAAVGLAMAVYLLRLVW